MSNDRPGRLPKARKDKLIIKELPDETLVYDRDTDEAHCLNLTAARIWKHCDGEKTVAQLRELMEKENRRPIPEEVIWLALDQLEQFRLLSRPVSKPTHLAGMSRRQLVRTLGVVAAVSIPLITSIVVPTPAQAASCTAPTDRDTDCPCTSSTQCTSLCCRDGLLVCKPGGGTCLP